MSLWRSILFAESGTMVKTTTSAMSTTATSCVRRDTTANGYGKINLDHRQLRGAIRVLTFGGNSRSNLNVWLFNHHTCFEGPTTSSSILSSDDPFTVSIR
jgi:hypothetical protein